MVRCLVLVAFLATACLASAKYVGNMADVVKPDEASGNEALALGPGSRGKLDGQGLVADVKLSLGSIVQGAQQEHDHATKMVERVQDSLQHAKSTDNKAAQSSLMSALVRVQLDEKHVSEMYLKAQTDLKAAMALGALVPDKAPAYRYDWQQPPAWPEASCQLGDSQSPIDIPIESQRAELASEPLGVSYTAGEALFAADEEQGLVIVGGAMGMLQVGGVSYNITQVNFKTPSEHTVKGKTFDVEMQVMHKQIGGDGLVGVSVLFERKGDSSEFLESIAFDRLPNKHYPRGMSNFDLNLVKGLDGDFLSYRGSVTHPPCTQNVQWFILSTVQEMSESQRVAIDAPDMATGKSNQIKNHARQIQPRNSRPVVVHRVTTASAMPKHPIVEKNIPAGELAPRSTLDLKTPKAAPSAAMAKVNKAKEHLANIVYHLTGRTLDSEPITAELEPIMNCTGLTCKHAKNPRNISSDRRVLRESARVSNFKAQVATAESVNVGLAEAHASLAEAQAHDQTVLDTVISKLKRAENTGADPVQIVALQKQLDLISYSWVNRSKTSGKVTDAYEVAKLKIKMANLQAKLDTANREFQISKQEVAAMTAVGTPRQLESANQLKVSSESKVVELSTSKADLTARIVEIEKQQLEEHIEISAHVPQIQLSPHKIGVNETTGKAIYQEVLDAAQEVDTLKLKLASVKQRRDQATARVNSSGISQIAQEQSAETVRITTTEAKLVASDVLHSEQKLRKITANSEAARDMIFIGNLKESVRNTIKEAVLQNEITRDSSFQSPQDKSTVASRPPLSVRFTKMHVNMHFVKQARTGINAISILWVQSHRRAFEEAFKADVAYSTEIDVRDVMINFISAAETKLPLEGLGGGAVVDFSIIGGLPKDIHMADDQFTWTQLKELVQKNVGGTISSSDVFEPESNAAVLASQPVAKKRLAEGYVAQEVHDVNPCMYCENGDDWTGMCSAGNKQSPIDLPADKMTSIGSGEPLALHFSASKAKVMNDGTAIVVRSALANTGLGEYIQGTKTYVANQAVFHAPSEHKIGGKKFPLEMQLQMSAKDGEDQMVMLSVLFSEGEANAALSRLDLQALPSVGEPSYTTFNRFNVSKFVSPTDTFVSYEGSQTQPPCTENVKWLVKQNHPSISTAQIKYFSNVFKLDKKFAKGQGNDRATKKLDESRTLMTL